MKETAKTFKQGTDVSELSFTALQEHWLDGTMRESWSCPFVTPPWVRSWWDVFGAEYEPLLLLVEQDRQPIGSAPLMIQGQTARCIGSADLCDHADFPVAPGYEDEFTHAVLNHLHRAGVQRLLVDSVRPESCIMQHLLPTAKVVGCRVRLKPHGGAVQMLLPNTWEDYLQSLSVTQRHEIRRKLRRVADAGVLKWDTLTDQPEVSKAMDCFVDFFKQSRPDKNEFMTPLRERYFRLLAGRLFQAGMLNLYRFKIDHLPAAVVFCVEAGSTTYLYNNGYSPRFRAISLGLVSKVMTIKASIAAGKQVYDFLNGTERYKFRLGGTEIPLSSCMIEW